MQLLGIILSLWVVVVTFFLLVWSRLMEDEQDQQEQGLTQGDGIEDDWQLWTDELIRN